MPAIIGAGGVEKIVEIELDADEQAMFDKSVAVGEVAVRRGQALRGAGRMNIHEYQAKALLKEYGVAVLRGQVAYTPEEAEQAARALGGPVWVVKAQIHAGGRGKGGGVKLARSVEEVRQLANDMLGMTLVTHQTGPQGRIVKRVYIEDGCNIARELYLGAVLDRATSRVTFMASTEGGVEIEEVAAKHPEKIIKVAIDPVTGFMPFHGRELAFGLGLKGKEVGKAVAFMKGLYQCVVERDASLVEINPLVVTADGDLVALDAKMNFDSNALYRQPKMMELRDLDEEDPHEIEASRHELNYIKLDGNIACMVNGAGLAMATMDIIKLYGGEPANFLDVGGGATKERVTAAFKLLLERPQRRGRAGQHLRRHHALRRDRRGRGRRRARGQPQRAAGGAARGHQRRSRQADHARFRPADHPGRRSRRCRREDRPTPCRRQPDVRPDRRQHQGHLPGLHRRPGDLPLRAGDRLRHPDGRRRDPGQGRREPSGPAGVRHRAWRRATRPAATPR